MMPEAKEEELTRRIRENLAAKPGDEATVIAWRGYLAACVEWGLVDIPTHLRLVRLLPQDVGVDATEIILLGLER